MGIRQSFIGVTSGLVGLLKTRLELFSLEAAGEKARAIKTLGLAFAALLFITLAVLVFSILISVYFWPTEQRYLALGVLAGVYGLIGIGLLLALRHSLIYDPAPFSATIAELGRDVQALTRTRTGGRGAAEEEGY